MTKAIKKTKKKSIQQNSTESSGEFLPTLAMRKWLYASQELPITASITDVAKRAKVDRTNWYLWLNIPEFVEWWDKQWKKYIMVHRHKLDLIGFKKAETDHTWWRDMKKIVGEAVPEDAPISPIQVNNQINVDKYMEEVPSAKD